MIYQESTKKVPGKYLGHLSPRSGLGVHSVPWQQLEGLSQGGGGGDGGAGLQHLLYNNWLMDIFGRLRILILGHINL